MAIKEMPEISYGFRQALVQKAKDPLKLQRDPNATDITTLGRTAVNEITGNTFILAQVTGIPAVAVWKSSSVSADPTFNSATITTTLDVGTALTVGTTATISGLGLGVVQADATGLLSSSDGINGQLLIASTGAAAPAWSTLTAGGGITIVETPGHVTISNPGATGTTSGTDFGGPVAPTAGGLTTFAGGTNMSTDGSVANTVTIDLDDDVALAGFLSTVGAVTAGEDLGMVRGQCLITADKDAAQAILLSVNGGTNETIDLYNVQGTSAAAISIQADEGGIEQISGLAANNAFQFTNADATGGMRFDFGTGGLVLTGVDGVFTVITGTAAISIGADAVQKSLTLGNNIGNTSLDFDCGTGNANFAATATVHDTVLGSLTGASSTTVRSGTGDLSLTSADDITVAANGDITLTPTGGNIVASTGNFTATTGNIVASAGDLIATLGAVNAATTVTSGTGITSTLGDITASAGDLVATAGALNVATTATAGTGVTATTGDVTTSAGDLVATLGALNVATTATAGTGVTATTGDVTASAGDLVATLGAVNAATTVTAGTGIIATTGNITATAGGIVAGGDSGTGFVTTNELTNVSDITVNGAGTFAIKSKNGANLDSAGFIKIWVGTTAYYVPVFSAVVG